MALRLKCGSNLLSRRLGAFLVGGLHDVNSLQPRGGILSTYPVALGSFGVLGGTSMAAPALTGAIALILQVRGTSTAEKLGIRDLLQSTAKPVLSNHTDGSPYQTLSQQGAGLVNVPQAAWAETIVRPGQLMLNDSGHFVPE
jgi:subtilisin family serine protease